MAVNAEHPDASEASAGPGLAVQTLHGEVEKILYESPDTAYSVVLVRDSGSGEPRTVCGTLPGVAPGQGITLHGHWEKHREYGFRLCADSFETSLPATEEGLIRYLSSGIVKGLGKKNAEAIVKAFGKNTPEVLENAPMRLREVPGLGKKRIEAVRKVWKENALLRDLQIHLQGYGISAAWFSRIFRTFGEETSEILHQDPYRLTEVRGIGFLTADSIAEKLGITRTDPRRLLAGVGYTLGQGRAAGHVCLPKEAFLDLCAELLSVERTDAEKALSRALALLQAAMRKSVSGCEMIYDPALLRCEDELPQHLADLMGHPRHAGRKLLKYSVLPGAIFSAEQLSAVEAAGKSPVSIITGGPGVGKTTVVSEIVRRAKCAGLRICLCAPTGRAAKRLSETTKEEAFTIHRLLKWDPVKSHFVYGSASTLPCDLLIADESSMLDIQLASALFRAVRPGTTVVIVGDADQLPSVGPGCVLNDLISSGVFPVTRLTRIFRQGPGSGIIRAAGNVNAGNLPVRTVRSGTLSDFYWIEKDDPDEVASIIERLVCERIPKRFQFDPMESIQVLSPMNRGSCGTTALNVLLQEKLNGGEERKFVSGERVFRVGDKVMQTANNYDKNVFNGDMGRIVEIRPGRKTFTVAYDVQQVEYEFCEADQIVLSYAVTIHKSQGSEFPAVVIPLLTQHYVMLQRNLLYTGMTRARKLMILVGSEKAVSMAVSNAVTSPRYSLLKERVTGLFRQKGVL